jgi:integrase
MPRARTGTLVPPGVDGLWRARVTKARADGSTTRPLYSLGTTDKALARRKLARLVAAVERGDDVLDAADTANAPERVKDYAEAWLAKREAQGVGMAHKERRNLELHALDVIGRLPLCDVRPSHVRGILDDALAGGLRRNSLAHIRGVLHRLFRAALEDELIEHNPVAAVRTPKTREVRKERAILTDDEFSRFVSCDAVDLELRMLALIARCEGGMRTGDLNNWDWSMIDRARFAECFIPRAKTRTPQRLSIPDVLAPFVRAWWERAGKPESGPVFPVTRGKRAGEARSPLGLSFAKRLRRDLFRARVYRMAPIEVPATSRGTRTDRGKFAKGTKLAPSPRDPLYHETATTLPVDFHSFRRAFNTALAEAGVNVQHAMHLASHSDPKVHARYVMSTRAMRTTPDAALPRLPVAGLAEASVRDGSTAGRASKVWANVTARDDSAFALDVPPEILCDFSAGEGSRTPDLARMKRPL